jgi:hypothetical protein
MLINNLYEEGIFMKKLTIMLGGGLAALALVLTPATAAIAGTDTSYDTISPTKNSCNITPQVNFTKTTKVKYGSSYYYDNYAYSGVAKGAKLKVGFNTTASLTKKGVVNYNKLKKYTKIKSVQWYTKDAKGKIKTVSKKNGYTVGTSAVGKLLYARYTYTCTGVPGTFAQVRFLGSSYYPKVGDWSTMKYVPIAKSGILTSAYPTITNNNDRGDGAVYIGDTLKASASIYFNRGIDNRLDKKANATTHKNAKYQWYRYNPNNNKYYKITGATKSTYKTTTKDKGYYLYAAVYATATGYAPTFNYNSNYETVQQ